MKQAIKMHSSILPRTAQVPEVLVTVRTVALTETRNADFYDPCVCQTCFTRFPNPDGVMVRQCAECGAGLCDECESHVCACNRVLCFDCWADTAPCQPQPEDMGGPVDPDDFDMGNDVTLLPMDVLALMQHDGAFLGVPAC